ncbi:cytochrome c553 [Bradyrhizobium sp. USDA 4448]
MAASSTATRASALSPTCPWVAWLPARALAARPELACSTCHGEKLTGTDVVPGIAGRSPTYLFRQLYDFRHGFRAGPNSKPMIDVVKSLDEGHLLPLAAYLATLER